jgi:2-polyprenyl-3-methyl-5-hydroxy-6-metoxy-1,4-benzoquinol methylase
MSHSCPLCSGTAIKKLFIKETIVYYSCNNCGFEFSIANNNANLDNAITDFETCYLQYFDEKASDKKNHESLLKWVKKSFQKDPATILDIGCGSGKWVNFLNEKGCEATGIEPSDALFSAYLSSKACFYKGTPVDYYKENPKKQFDVITAFDVLEHVTDPISFLHHASLMMHQPSLLFMSMPDSGSMYRKSFGKRWHYFNKYHFSYFSEKTLQKAAEQVGLVVVSHTYRSRYFQVKYVWDYFKNFVLRKKTPYRSADKGLIIPINLFDNMYCVLRKA